MNVCVVSSFPPTVAGVADYGAHLVRHLGRDTRVKTLTVLADRTEGAPGWERIERVDVRRVWRPNAAAIGLELVRAVETVRPDVVWFNLGLTMFGTRPTAVVSGLLAPLCTTRLGYRTVVTLHELPSLADLAALGIGRVPGWVGAALVPRLVLRADTVVVTLDRYRRFLVERYGAGNVRRIPLGAYGDLQCLDEPRQDAVLVFGTFGPHKEPGLVAEAVTLVRRKRPRVQLMVAGADHPRYPGFMANCCARHGLQRSWLGYVPADRLGGLFARATVVVVPSRATTGSSGVIYRAVGHGRTVLASDLVDFQGLAQDDDLQLAWFKAGDVAGLASALEGLLDDPVRRHAAVTHNLRTMELLRPARIVDAYIRAFQARAPRRQPHHDPAAAELALAPGSEA